MKTKELCNETYKDLCAELGQLQLQKDALDKRAAEILAQIQLLNALSPKLQSLESKIEAVHNPIILGC